MLLKNPLQPPVPPRHPAGLPPHGVRQPSTGAAPFVSADDFDVTGVLGGMDPCESRYWWMPELHAAAAVDPCPAAVTRGSAGGPTGRGAGPGPRHAADRIGTASSAAA